MSTMKVEKGMKEFKDYYPIRKCGNQELFRCECGHLEKNIKLLDYLPGYLYDHWTIECEKCKSTQEHSG